MKAIKFLLAITLAFVCMTSCSSDDDDEQLKVTKRVKTVSVSAPNTSLRATFSYEDDKVSKIIVNGTAGETMTLTYEYQSEQFIEKGTNDFYNGGGDYVMIHKLGNNGLVNTSTRNGEPYQTHKQTNGYYAGYDFSDEKGETYTISSNGSMTAIDSYKVTPSKIENKSQIFQYGLYLGDMRLLKYYTGLFGKPTKYLPSNTEIEGSMTFSYELDEDGYVVKITIKDSDYTAIETYTYETIQ